MKNVGKVLSYILIGIVLIPVAAIVIYLALGMAMYLIEYIYYRKKYGPIGNTKESKTYKNIGAIIIIVFVIGLFLTGQRNILTVRAWLFCNIGAFLGLLPMCIYILREIKKQKYLAK